MKRLIFSFLMTGLLAVNTQAQTTAPSSGKITYEGMRQIDFSQMRRNGFGGPPAGGGAPESSDGTSAPEVMNFTQKLVFAGTMAKEERDRPQGMMRRNRADGNDPSSGQAGPGGGGRAWGAGNGQRMTPPFEQTTFLDLANRQRIDVLTVRKDSTSQTTYRSERAMPAATDWKEADKTKKIAGYICHKATATHRKAPYTIWYTTDLPFTYSPVADLTPPKGVVLQIESDSESYKATTISSEAIAEATVQPPKDAKAVSAEELEQIRRKGMADFRQRMMQNGTFQRN